MFCLPYLAFPQATSHALLTEHVTMVGVVTRVSGRSWGRLWDKYSFINVVPAVASLLYCTGRTAAEIYIIFPYDFLQFALIER